MPSTVRSLFTPAALALCASSLFAQSAPVPAAPPTPKPPADSARSAAVRRTEQYFNDTAFERVADQLRRAGDAKLADELMEAARKIAASKDDDKPKDGAAEAVPPVQGARAARRTRNTGQAGHAPALSDTPVVGRLFSRGGQSAAAPQAAAPAQPVEPSQAPAAVARGSYGLGQSRAPVPGTAPTPAPHGSGKADYTHHHEVHHYFHGTPPAGVMQGVAPAPAQGSGRGGVRTRAEPGVPVAPAPRAMGGTAAPAPTAAPEPPSRPRGLAMGGALSRTVTPPPHVTSPGRPATPQPARRARSAEPTSKPAGIESEVDGLRREVEELRELLDKLRTQLKQRKPD